MPPHVQSTFLPFNLHGLTLEQVYARLDQEISGLQERLCSLRTFRNSLVPVAKLPTEILSKIFVDTQDCVDSSDPYKVDVETRCFVSWVCRHWRDTAIATPDLWTVISKKNRDNPVHVHFATELLARNRNMNLAINLFQPTAEVLKAFIPHMHRMEHMRVLEGPPESESEIYRKLFSQPAPLLLSLELSNEHSAQKIFSNHHPQLQRLVFRKANLYVPLPAFEISTLTVLQVFNTDHLFLDYLVEILPSLDNLTELVIARSLHYHHQPVTRPQERVDLPNLQSISITEVNTEAVFGFLGCLDVPQAVIALAWPEDIDCTPDNIQDFMVKLRRYQNQMQFPIGHLKMTRVADFTLDLSSTRSLHRHSFLFPSLELESNDTTELFFNSGFGLNQLRSFFIDEFQRRMLRQLSDSTTLTHVTLYGQWTVEGFADEFERDADLFPAMKKLTLYKYQELDESLLSLENILSIRSAQGRALDKLVFIESPGVDVTKYEKFVKTVSVE